MTRRLEKNIALVGALLVLVFLGGFSLTIMNIEQASYQEVIVPFFEGSMPDIASEEGFEAMRTLAAWFGVTAFLTLILVAVANLFVSNNKHPKRAAIFYGLTGLLVLFGSQLIAYPLAFIFFVVMGLCLLRKEEEEEVL